MIMNKLRFKSSKKIKNTTILMDSSVVVLFAAYNFNLRVFVSIILLLSLLSCRKNNKENIKVDYVCEVVNISNQINYREATSTVEFMGKKEFVLDSLSLNILGYLQYIHLDTIEYLTFLNEFDNSIYFYDYKSEDFLRKIALAKERKIPKIQGYNYINDDTIFIYNYSRHKIYRTNIHAELLSEDQLYDRSVSNNKNDILFPAPYLHTPSPLKHIDNKLVTVGFVGGEYNWETDINRPVVTVLNLENKRIDQLLNYPKQYTKFNWGGGLTFRMPYYDIANNFMIVSFSAHHDILKVDISTGNVEEYYAGSKFVEKITSYPFPKEERYPSISEWEWYMTTPSYEGIFYDKYKDIYYRIVRLPVNKYIDDEKYNSKTTSIIILDSNLNYIGESKLPTSVIFSPFNSFVSDEGLNIQVYTGDEDVLTFYQYKIKR